MFAHVTSSPLSLNRGALTKSESVATLAIKVQAARSVAKSMLMVIVISVNANPDWSNTQGFLS